MSASKQFGIGMRQGGDFGGRGGRTEHEASGVMKIDPCLKGKIRIGGRVT